MKKMNQSFYETNFSEENTLHRKLSLKDGINGYCEPDPTDPIDPTPPKK